RWLRMARSALDGRLLDTARDLAEAVPADGATSAYVDVTLGRLELAGGDAAAALARADAAIERARHAGDPASECGGHDLRARALDFLGRRDDAVEAWTRQEAVAAAAGLVGERMRAVVSIAEMELFLAEAPVRMYEAVQLA